MAVPDAAIPCLIAALYEELDLPVMVVTARPGDARKLQEQLQSWCSPRAGVYCFPELDFPFYDSRQPSAVSAQGVERLQALAALALSKSFTPCHSEGEKRPKNLLQDRPGKEPGDPSLPLRVTVKRPPLVIAPGAAIASRTMPKDDFVSSCHTLKPGTNADPLKLLSRWQKMGYEVESLVELPGTMSRRGGIVDIFPPDSNLPVRIEFSGNRVESLRSFEPASQRSTGLIASVTVIPAREIAAEGGNVLDYLPGGGLLILNSPSEIAAVVQKASQQAQDAGVSHSPYLAWSELEPGLLTRSRVVLNSWDAQSRQSLPFSLPQSYGGRLEMFLGSVPGMLKGGQRLVVVSHQADRLAELLDQQGIPVSPAPQVDEVPPRGSITLVPGSLAGGWVVRDVLTLLTDSELFGFARQARRVKKAPLRRRWLFPRLTPGDYVVHVDHGIARFGGLVRRSDNGVEREYLVLQYAANDRLYVPVENVERVSRYVGGVQSPVLSRLGTQDWERTKRRIKQSVADIARELLDLYARREVASGFAFSGDTLWQQEMEASFPYMETPDQLEAIGDVKADMEKARPMERLICGDVGYGKTEVAVRAAFKAVMANKQVAVLVPTTVLAQQHFVTFRERLGAFPVRVEVLSRFCSPEEEKAVLEGLARGRVDICIGTHRLLQKDVVFRDLGLVIIDEEQRFGVMQKEKLKQVRKEVDVLTLSATPIPRTLHMSLTGIRDMNVMETPPEERLSIKTYVGVYDEGLVRQAIVRELERNGQVFFVHNRVSGIALVADRLQSLVPGARLAIAHGRMPEEKLEGVMADFIAGRSDVLLTTTIVQLGLDMPNVNTLIVDQADRFGLTQLYQLRGRVGRGINQAYAYFLFDRERQLTHRAQERLRTIFEAAELGAGFSIAMKDLEIRGAGNLLGVRQSGYIAAIGFDLYSQLLAEAVAELKAGENVIASPLANGKQSVSQQMTGQSPGIALPLDAYIPEEYVADLDARLSLYRKLAGIKSVAEVRDMTQELEDRFGSPPPPVKNLLYVVEIKALAARVGVESISTSGRWVTVKLGGGREVKSLPRLGGYGGAVRVGHTQLKLDIKSIGSGWTAALKEMLQALEVVPAA